MKKYSLYILVISFVLAGFHINIYSQPSTIWAKVFRGPAIQQDSSIGVSINASGMVFVTGWSIGSGTGADIVTVRYEPSNGDTLWVNRYSGPMDEKVLSITSDNNAVYVTGWSFTPSRDVITIKYDAITGTRLWVKTYNGTGNGGDYGFSIAVDGSGNVYVTGRSDVGGSQKYTTLKYDASGNMAAGWPSVYSGGLSNIFDEARSVKADGSGNAYITGKSGTGAVSTDDILSLKINSNGTVAWAKKHNGTSNFTDEGISVALDNTFSSVYVAGYSFRAGTNQDFITIKYNASTGDSLAAAVYDGPASNIDQVSAMTIDNLNNVYVTGISTGVSTAFDYATVKYNSSLAQQWVKRTTNTGNDFPSSITVENVSGNVYVTGSSLGSGTGMDYLTVSYRGNGDFGWEQRENGSANSNDYASGIAVQDTDRIYVTGTARFSVSNSVYYTLRYSKVSAVNPISNIVPSTYDLAQNYPNPFNPSTSIRFDIPKSSLVKISVFDITGKEADVLLNEYVNLGQYEITWNAYGFSSGIYFYTISAGDFRETKKMILVK